MDNLMPPATNTPFFFVIFFHMNLYFTTYVSKDSLALFNSAET